MQVALDHVEIELLHFPDLFDPLELRLRTCYRNIHVFNIDRQILWPYVLIAALWWSQLLVGSAKPAFTREIAECSCRRPGHGHLYVVVRSDRQLATIYSLSPRIIRSMFGRIPSTTCQIQAAGKRERVIQYHHFLMMGSA